MNKNKKLKNTIYTILPIISIVLFVALWIILSYRSEGVFPSPVGTWQRFLLLLEKPIKKTSLLGHAWASLRRVLIALIFSWTIGISFGILIGWNKTCKALLGTIFECLRPIPPIAWIPIVIMCLGIGETAKVVVVFIGTFTPVVINTSAGITLVDKLNIDVGKAFGGNQRQVLFDIVIPTAYPSIFTGIRTSVGSGWTVVLAAEMLGASKGLGFLVTRGWEGGDMALVVVTIVCIGIIGALLSLVMAVIERRLCPWNN